MTADAKAIIDAAIAWQVRLATADEAAWADFVVWLEASPDHATTYDVIASQERLVDAARFPAVVLVAPAHNDNAPRSRRLWAIGGMAAAAVVTALLVPSMMASHASPYEIATQPGQRRTVALADGTTIDVSGGTRLMLDRSNSRVASLDQGEATFHVRHDAARPFAITSGGVTIRDLGTVFNVARSGDQLSVAVADGSVQVRPHGDGVTLKAGEALSLRESTGRIVRSNVSPDSVGGWRSGALSFDGQPLSDVAAMLNRLYAANVATEGRLSAQPFTGMIRFTGAAERDVPHLAALIGAKWRRDGDRWILSGTAPVSR